MFYQKQTLTRNRKQQLEFQCGWITVGVVFNAVGALVMDKLGRKPLMLFGVAGCGVCLAIEAAIVATYAEEGTNKAALAAGVGKSNTIQCVSTGRRTHADSLILAMFYLFLAVYSMGVDVAGVVFYSELFPNHIRAKGVCLSMATVALTDLVYLQATTTAFANIGWRFYLVSHHPIPIPYHIPPSPFPQSSNNLLTPPSQVFIIICFLGTIFFIFTLPETKGIPLEEMAKIFGDTEDVMVYAKDLHVDHNTHELVVGKDGLEHVATHQNITPEIEKAVQEHRERGNDV
jgi:MFS family permease